MARASVAPAPDSYGPVGRSAWLDVDWRAHQRWLDVDGQAVNVVDLGSHDAPAVLLVHGHAGSWRVWLETLPALAATRRVVAVDLPGFGQSPLPAGGISVAGWAACLSGVLDALGLASAAVVGYSMGGMVAAELAASWPARVERLVLVAAAGLEQDARRSPRVLAALRRVAGPLTAYNAFVGTRAEIFARRRRLRRALWGMSVRRPDALPAPLVAEQLRAAAAPGFLDGLAAINEHPLDERLASIRCPVLVVWGAADRMVPVADAARFGSLIADARVAVYPDTGHMPQLERPERFVADVAGFLDGG